MSADRTVHPERWLEDAPALFIPMTIAASGIRSIRPLRFGHQDERRYLQHLASGVLREPLGCFRFHLGQLVLHLLDEAGHPSVPVFESGGSTYDASQQLKPMGAVGALTYEIGLQTLYLLDGAGQVFSDKPCQLSSNSNREFEWDELCQLYRRVVDATVRAVGMAAGWDNRHASSIDSPDPVVLILWSV